ncbi:MAG: hypothetical protein Q7T13_11600 [Polaromonas sp.]|nr:hypothetical protein [Polaromonas sp.]
MFPSLGLRTVVLMAALAGVAACAPSDAPSPVMENGKIAEVRNCPSTNPKYKVECLRLACEQSLFERGTLPPYARVIQARSDYNISDMPGQSTHTMKFSEQDKFRYAMCEMEGEKITAVRELSAREQSW